MLADTLADALVDALAHSPGRGLARRLACLALLLAARPAAALSPLYTTELEKTTAPAPLGPRADAARFAIPGGQCSGYVDQSLLCGARRAAAVRLTVRDAAFAALRVDDELTSATVMRARCDGDAEVELRVACAPAPRAPPAAPSAQRRARAAARARTTPPDRLNS